MDKGAINEGHVLLLPIEHYASSLACSANAWAEMQRYLSALKACAASQVTSLWPIVPTPHPSLFYFFRHDPRATSSFPFVPMAHLIGLLALHREACLISCKPLSL